MEAGGGLQPSLRAWPSPPPSKQTKGLVVNTAEYNKAYYAENREQILEQKRSYYLENREKILDGSRERYQNTRLARLRRRRIVKYGVDDEVYASMLDEQNGACAICGERPNGTLCVDHNHESGAVRGLLCSRCNSGLGFFGDSSDVLARASRYLTREV